MKAYLILSSWILLTWATPQAFALESSAVVGNYELRGVIEAAGMLMLKADQKYQAGFSYGAADWLEEGTWKLEGDVVVLQDGRFKAKNYDKLSLFLAPGTRMKYQDAKLTSLDLNRKFAFLNPDNTPSPPQKTAAACEPLQDSSLKLTQGSLLAVEKNQVIINDVLMHQDVTVKRAWAEKNIPTLLTPPQLFKSVQGEIPKSSITCIMPVLAGEGRMRVRGRVVKLDTEYLMIEMGECLTFDAKALPPAVLKTAKDKSGGSIDVEIPYSAMISSGGC